MNSLSCRDTAQLNALRCNKKLQNHPELLTQYRLFTLVSKDLRFGSFTLLFPFSSSLILSYSLTSFITLLQLLTHFIDIILFTNFQFYSSILLRCRRWKGLSRPLSLQGLLQMEMHFLSRISQSFLESLRLFWSSQWQRCLLEGRDGFRGYQQVSGQVLCFLRMWSMRLRCCQQFCCLIAFSRGLSQCLIIITATKEQQMEEIPNTSVIFRDLKGIGSQVDSIAGKRGGGASGWEGVVDEEKNHKREKHDAIMKRLNDSKKLMGDLIGTPSYQQKEQSKDNVVKFVPPQIRYRHLEHQEKKKSLQDAMSYTQSMVDPTFRGTRDIETQYEEQVPETQFAGDDNDNKYQVKVTELNASGDILQRYYDLYSKDRKTTPSGSLINSRFTRDTLEDDSKIEQAIQILLRR